MWYIGNAFSLSMTQGNGSLKYQRATLDQVRHWVKRTRPTSFFGHVDVANIVSKQVGIEIPTNRINVMLKPGDNVIVAQYIGPRLPEGTTELPGGARIEYILVTLSVEAQEVTDFEFDEGSEYGKLLQKAQEVASLVGGRAVVKKDNYENYYFEIEGRGFTASLWEE
jgi:hypothetical protein